MEPDFGGYATKAGLKCSDGRTITPDAFKHLDQKRVPLVWMHDHNDPENVLGHTIFEARPDGMYVKAFFNTTPKAQSAKVAVEHGDVNALSIWANGLQEQNKLVTHGEIREVSLVLAGANPGALIDFINIRHGDGDLQETDEAIIHTGLPLELKHADQGPTVQDIIDSMTEEQQGAMALVVSQVLEQAGIAAHSDTKPDEGEPTDDAKPDDKKSDEGEPTDNKPNEGEPTDDANQDKEGTGIVTHNVFDQTGKTDNKNEGKHVLSHDAMVGIVKDAKKPGNTLKGAVEGYAMAHGIEVIDILFPEAKTLNNMPEMNTRRTEWVQGVLSSTRKSPFSRIKSVVADLTQDAARAKGYIKGNYKKEEWFGLTSRKTSPTTIYKKQKLDRDDIIDAADFPTVSWLKTEMRFMWDEEVARAILLGDGRDPGDEDKIKDPGSAAEGEGIRAIINENELYATTVNINITATPNYEIIVEELLRARRFLKGTGQPTFYSTNQVIVEMLLQKDSLGRRLYADRAALAAALMVDSIVEVEPMEEYPDLFGIIVNLADYNVGTDRGGEMNMFDDFDIDYNQYKYLIEGRMSGALVKIKSALILKKVASTDTLVAPTTPTFVESTGVVTIPTKTGVVYKNADTAATLSSGAQTALAAGATLNVLAVASSGYYFQTNAEDEWHFTRPSA